MSSRSSNSPTFFSESDSDHSSDSNGSNNSNGNRNQSKKNNKNKNSKNKTTSLGDSTPPEYNESEPPSKRQKISPLTATSGSSKSLSRSAGITKPSKMTKLGSNTTSSVTQSKNMVQGNTKGGRKNGTSSKGGNAKGGATKGRPKGGGGRGRPKGGGGAKRGRSRPPSSLSTVPYVPKKLPIPISVTSGERTTSAYELFQNERIELIIQKYHEREIDNNNTSLNLSSPSNRSSRSSGSSRSSSSSSSSKREEKEEKEKREDLLYYPISQHDMRSKVGHAWEDMNAATRLSYVAQSQRLKNEALDMHAYAQQGTERNKTHTTTNTIEKLLYKLEHEDEYDLSIMRLKNHGLPPNINGVQMNRVLEALESCHTIQVLYIQNLANGMRDEQLRSLMKVSIFYLFFSKYTLNRHLIEYLFYLVFKIFLFFYIVL